MDTITLGRFITGLDTDVAERVTVEELAPGCVIATGTWKRHVVVETPRRLNGHTTTMVVPMRHLGGGHTCLPYLPGGASVVRIYRTRLPEHLLADVPFVPPCVIPDEPAVGDRVLMNWRTEGDPYVHEWDGEHWVSTYRDDDGHPQTARYATYAVRAFVRLTDTPIQYGWYTYEPAQTA
jgi:hypothetical protein